MFFKSNSSKVHSLILEQIKDVEGCLTNFGNFLKAATNPNGDMETLRALDVSVHEMENAADRSLRAMIDSLNDSFLPATRTELIEIATSCDKVANKCQHVAHMCVYQKFRFPAQYRELILTIYDHSQKEFQLLTKAIEKLFASFGELLSDHSILDDIRGLEHQVDLIEDQLYESIYALELSLAERMQIATFVEWVCDVADIIENIADKIQIMLIVRKV